jgi:hypothetical protein
MSRCSRRTSVPPGLVVLAVVSALLAPVASPASVSAQGSGLHGHVPRFTG